MRRSQVRRIATATVLALLALAGTTAAGFWQYDRAHRDDIAKQVLAAAAVPVQTLVAPGTYVPEDVFGHRVVVTGDAQMDDAVVSCDRIERGNAGCWLLAPVIGAGAGVVVVLGWIPEADLETQLKSLRNRNGVTWSGRLQPAELVDRGTALMRPSDRIAAVNTNALAMRWQRDLLDGYVVLDTPVVGSAVSQPLLLPPSGITWRNLIYAWQWWAFAGFVVFLLARYILDVRAEAIPEPRKDFTP